MKGILKNKRWAWTIILLFSAVFILIQCIDNGKEQTGVIRNTKGQQFAGSATCAACHKDIYEAHLNTAHYLTSRPGSVQYIRGSFEPGKNSYAYNPASVIFMEKSDTSFFQTEYRNGAKANSRRIDIVIGSGQMGQSFLTWDENKLSQLPITYFSAADQWSNSPGYPPKVLFDRPITSRCLECHVSYAKTISAPGAEREEFDHSQLIFGVDCEKCHGPAADHLMFHQQHTNEKSGKNIINPARLSRQQNLDLCASCHGGRLKKTTPSFQFTVGDRLGDHFISDTTRPDPNNIDVHGNQYGLLRASKCFIKSETLTCNSCHNPHKNERSTPAVFSQRCIACHNAEHEPVCKLTKTVGEKIKENCIDCHMPLQSSKAIAVLLPGAILPTAAVIRSHYIALYPRETEKILAFMKKAN
jgi:mono/diheme cytochrome c family protein